jgi:hypothetical protein
VAPRTCGGALLAGLELEIWANTVLHEFAQVSFGCWSHDLWGDLWRESWAMCR